MDASEPVVADCLLRAVKVRESVPSEYCIAFLTSASVDPASLTERRAQKTL